MSQTKLPDPMAEDEQIDDLVETIYWGKEWTRDDLTEMVKAYTTNKIIEELEKYKWHKPNYGMIPDIEYINQRIAELRKTL